MTSTSSIVRCASPYSTAVFTAAKTVSHVTWKARATSFQLILCAHPARNHAKLVVIDCLPFAHGTASTTTRLQFPHEMRRIAYRKNTASPHSGTNWNRRSCSVSYVGPGFPHREQIPLRPFAGRIRTRSTGRGRCRLSSNRSYTKPLCFSTKLSRVLSCTVRLPWLRCVW